MGYIAHNAIVVTSWDARRLGAAFFKAHDLGLVTSGLSPEVTNGYQSFLVAPDGSKEGWDESETGDTRRITFKVWLREQRYEDGGSVYEWVEVRFGSDEWGSGGVGAEVVDHEWADRLDPASPPASS